MALSITSGAEELLHVSFDLSPAQAAASKQSIVDYAVEQNALVFAHHFPPFPNLGHVVKQDAG